VSQLAHGGGGSVNVTALTLDRIEYTIIRNTSTAMLTFVSGKLGITFGSLTVPLTPDIKKKLPEDGVRPIFISA
jgi:hypothetical protein